MCHDPEEESNTHFSRPAAGCAAAVAFVYCPVVVEYVLSPLPSSATYRVCAFANHMPNGNIVVDVARFVGKPLRMHMLLGLTPWVCRTEGSYASGEVGSCAPGSGSPTPLGHALPVVSTKYTVLIPLPPLPLV